MAKQITDASPMSPGLGGWQHGAEEDEGMGLVAILLIVVFFFAGYQIGRIDERDKQFTDELMERLDVAIEKVRPSNGK